MQRRLAAAVLIAAVGGGDPAAARAGDPALPHDLALRSVTLTLAGVAYFDYAANVDGAATLGLDLSRDQVSDALTSLLVLDSAGSVVGLELPGEQGAAAAFTALPFGPAALSSPLALLNGLAGTELQVHAASVAGGVMGGRVLRAQMDPELPAGARTSLPRTRVTLLTDTGLRQFVLEDADSVQVADPALRARIAAALEAVRADGNAANERRHLTLRLAGSGPRTVEVGMVLEAPVWKTSYRLVLPARDAAASTARLQAWAVLENATATDWNGVTLSLLSGNPVTLRQAIYRMVRVERPEVPVASVARLVPPVDTRARVVGMAKAAMMAAPPPPPPSAPAPAMAAPEQAAAVAEQGDDSVFTLPQPLSLAAGHTASVPFLDRPLPAQLVGLLAQDEAHPVASVRVTNDTGASLPPGLVATYAEGGFAGDARLGPLPPGESRLLSFSQDPRTTADWSGGEATTLVGLTASRGVVHVTRRSRTTVGVHLAAPADTGRDLLLSLPRDPDIQPDAQVITTEPPLPIESTATAWRVAVTLKPGEQRDVVAHIDLTLSEETALTDNPEAVVALLHEEALAAPARAALQHVADLRAAEADRITARDALLAQRREVEADEARLRQNLAVVPAADALHARLIAQLAAAEDRLAGLFDTVSAARQAAEQAHAALLDAIAGLVI